MYEKLKLSHMADLKGLQIQLINLRKELQSTLEQIATTAQRAERAREGFIEAEEQG